MADGALECVGGIEMMRRVLFFSFPFLLVGLVCIRKGVCFGRFRGPRSGLGNNRIDPRHCFERALRRHEPRDGWMVAFGVHLLLETTRLLRKDLVLTSCGLHRWYFVFLSRIRSMGHFRQAIVVFHTDSCTLTTQIAPGTEIRVNIAYTHFFYQDAASCNLTEDDDGSLYLVTPACSIFGNL